MGNFRRTTASAKISVADLFARIFTHQIFPVVVLSEGSGGVTNYRKKKAEISIRPPARPGISGPWAIQAHEIQAADPTGFSAEPEHYLNGSRGQGDPVGILEYFAPG